MARFHLETLGCRANLADSLALGGLLAGAGWQRADDPREADLILINSCTVTERADADLRQLVARLRRKNPDARLIVTGCLAAIAPSAIASWPGVSDVLASRSPAALLARLAGDELPDAAAGTLWDAPTAYPQFAAAGHTRAFVKVQEGCDASCSFCVIPQTRGRSRSLAPERVVATLRALGESGAGEVVLTGIHLGSYGRDLGTSLVALLDQLERLDRPERIRLTSIEPNEVSEALIDRLRASGRIAPHLHLPLQSGSDRVLARMRRPYTSRRYAGVVARLARAVPQIAIGADVIAGFPGESDDDFAATVAQVQALPLAYLHPFRYSPRPGTEAAGLDGRLPPAVVAARGRELRAVGGELARSFAVSLVGRRERALTIVGAGEGSQALTGRFVPVHLAEALAPNRMVDVRITSLRADQLWAEQVDSGEERPVCQS